jgi:hypothetical protein
MKIAILEILFCDFREAWLISEALIDRRDPEPFCYLKDKKVASPSIFGIIQPSRELPKFLPLMQTKKLYQTLSTMDKPIQTTNASPVTASPL